MSISRSEILRRKKAAETENEKLPSVKVLEYAREAIQKKMSQSHEHFPYKGAQTYQIAFGFFSTTSQQLFLGKGSKKRGKSVVFCHTQVGSKNHTTFFGRVFL